MTGAVEVAAFRAAMARLGAAVNIITTDGPAGRHGMTASAVCSVSDEPASLLVCINRASRMHAAITANGVLSINVLAGDHQELSGLFASRGLSVEDRFARAEWDILDNGSPALTGALCTFGCRVASISDVGTHGVFFCDVTELRAGERGEGLVYFGRGYHRLPMECAA